MTPHDAALRYARRGWRVVPIIEGTKRPALTRWPEQATTDPDTIDAWWRDAHAGCGVGIVTGAESGIFVLDVDDHDSLVDLEQRYEPLPDTLTSLTGSGGTHLFFRWPGDGREIRNDAGRRLGPKLDIRGNGGQVCAPPTVHPNGVAYAFDAGMPGEPAEAPAWLLDLVTMAEPTLSEAEARTLVERTDRPGDRWAAATPWADILGRDGWTLHHQDPDGECYWTRPGKSTRDGASATTGYAGTGGLKVFSTSLAHMGLEPDASYSKLGYLAATRFDGDHGAAASFLVAQGWGGTDEDVERELTDFLKGMQSVAVSAAVSATLEAVPEPDDGPRRSEWDWIDAASVLDGGWDPPTPTVLTRLDGVGLLYPGKIHSLAGEPGSGKSWLALEAVRQTLEAGGSVLYLDYEDGPQGMFARLRALGVDPVLIRAGFQYVRPGGPLAEPDRVRIEQGGWSLVVVDSAGESLAVEGVNPNADDEVAGWFRRLPRLLAANGATVLLLDHVAKDRETRGGWAIGSQRKLAAIDGAAYTLEVISAPTRETEGKVLLRCSKDRHGTHQRGGVVAEVTVSAGDSVKVTVLAPQGPSAPTAAMERVCDWLEVHGPASTSDVDRNVMGRKQVLIGALNRLEALGHVRCERQGRTFEWSWISSYRAGDELFAALNGSGPSVPEGAGTDAEPVPGHGEDPIGSSVPIGSPSVPGTGAGSIGSSVPGVISSPGPGNRSDPLEQGVEDDIGSSPLAGTIFAEPMPWD